MEGFHLHQALHHQANRHQALHHPAAYRQAQISLMISVTIQLPTMIRAVQEALLTTAPISRPLYQPVVLQA